MRILKNGRIWVILAASPIGTLVTMAFVMGATGSDEQAAAPPPVPAESEIVAFAGSQPDRCVHSAPGFELCTWSLDGRLLGAGLPEDGTHGVRLVCEIALDPQLRGDSRCVAHVADARELRSLPAVSAASDAARYATGDPPGARLARSQTLPALSHLVGDVPDRCLTGAGIQTCTWSIDAGAEGYEIFAALAATEGAVSLRCELPLDGSPRALGSCGVTPAD